MDTHTTYSYIASSGATKVCNAIDEYYKKYGEKIKNCSVCTWDGERYEIFVTYEQSNKPVPDFELKYNELQREYNKLNERYRELSRKYEQLQEKMLDHVVEASSPKSGIKL